MKPAEGDERAGDLPVPPETAAEAARAVRRTSAAYFALQGALVLAWWVMLWQLPATRAHS